MAKFISLEYGGKTILWNLDLTRSICQDKIGDLDCVSFVDNHGWNEQFWFKSRGEAEEWFNDVRRAIE